MKSLGLLVLPQSWDAVLELGFSFAAVEPVFCPVGPGPWEWATPLFTNLLSIPSPITQTSRPYCLPSNSLDTSCPDYGLCLPLGLLFYLSSSVGRAVLIGSLFLCWVGPLLPWPGDPSFMGIQLWQLAGFQGWLQTQDFSSPPSILLHLCLLYPAVYSIRHKILIDLLSSYNPFIFSFVNCFSSHILHWTVFFF